MLYVELAEVLMVPNSLRIAAKPHLARGCVGWLESPQYSVLDEITSSKQEKSLVICHYWSPWVIINDSVHICTYT